MLPYTPLHHLLLAEMAGPLVMTSGNLSDEPIAHRDDEARARLGHLADVFLTHDRPIHVACDDSVVRPHRAGPMPIRRARGHVPTPIAVAPGEELPAVLACGGDLKHTFCLTRGGMALMSQHLGDLENVVTLEHARAMIDHFCAFYDVHPAIIAHDLHPDYHATRLARSLPAARHIAVQHHHAHVAACMAEHRLAGPVIGIAFDGTGLGTDGVIWGGEVLVADFQGFQRVGHLAEFALPGGEAAIRRPGRVALAHLLRMGLDAREAARLVPGLTDAEADVVALQVARGLNAPRTTSMGRLFDAVSALLGICAEVTYEGQAAIELEAAAQAYSPFPEGKGVGGLGPRGSAEHLPDSLLARSADAPWLLDPALLIHALLDGRRAGVPVGELAAGFHAAIAAATADLCARVRDDGGPNQVALSGGVFQNVLLLDSLTAGLVARGFSVFRHQQVPCNDGGLSLGQAMIAARRR
jgi:hydrogenase maturation protein HypF